MVFNLLIHDYPETVEVDGREYKVNSDYKDLIRINLLLIDDIFSQREKIEFVLNLFFINEIPNDHRKAFEALMLFLHGYEDSNLEEEKDILGNVVKSNQVERAYDFQVDAARIYSAFFQMYGLRLDSDLKMHWFIFKALMDNLNEGVPQLVRIMEYRTMNLNEHMSKEQRGYYNKMKKKYRLLNGEQEDNEQNEFANAFMSGIHGKR